MADESEKYYPNTSKVLKRAILMKYPDAEANEYRAEWRDDFENFRKNQKMVASRLLWMLEWMKTEEFFHNGMNLNEWIGSISGIMEGLGWINPGTFISALHTDSSMGKNWHG